MERAKKTTNLKLYVQSLQDILSVTSSEVQRLEVCLEFLAFFLILVEDYIDLIACEI
jgi:hypothetical protein